MSEKKSNGQVPEEGPDGKKHAWDSLHCARLHSIYFLKRHKL